MVCVVCTRIRGTHALSVIYTSVVDKSPVATQAVYVY